MSFLFRSLSAFFPFFETAIGRAQLGRSMACAALAIALWVGSVGLYLPSAQAANATKPEANDLTAVRPTRNPLSNENFQGGVDLTALDRQGKTVPPLEEPEVSLIDRLKNLLPGLSSDKPPTSPSHSTVQPQRNPTLDRYTNHD